MTTVGATGARSLRRQMRAWRRDRADTTLYEQASEAYVWVFTIVLGGAMAISAMVQTRVSIASACTTSTCDDARTSLVWATVAGMVATTLAAAQAIGPVMVTPATGAWLLTTPCLSYTSPSPRDCRWYLVCRLLLEKKEGHQEERLTH
ncbi:DUF6297 family protein [Aeromicrobium fastidiosum]|uniref:DUF6297 family protein n=1 Tax=Aeromicrobium fastidiosum TaxID=52699 RepID=UPI0020235522|nr:DUF6297 family protein [Aeromicrobium fastidiosum]MCL8253352.1 DUF6297 family protein [Aeromicrobium fastidiosum]